MAGRNSGVSSLIIEDVKNKTVRYLTISHCWLHQENLCAKSLVITNVVTTASKLATFIRPKIRNLSQLKFVLSDMETEYEYVVSYTELHSWRRGRVLKRVYDFTSEIELFPEMENQKGL
jgi:hypothetical protein